MCERRLDGRGLSAYRAYLIQEERAPSTVEKYLRDGRAFAAWLGDAAVSLLVGICNPHLCRRRPC